MAHNTPWKVALMGSGDNDDGLAKKKSDIVNNPDNLDSAISGSGSGLSSQNGSSNFFGHEGTSNALKVEIQKLNGKNYVEWSQTARLILDDKGIYGFLTGEVQMSATTDPKYRFWKSENSVIIDWLLSNMESTIKKPFMFFPTAKEVWEAVKETYSDIQNSSQIFDLKSRLWHTRQGDRDVTTYYNELMTLWQELDLCYDDNWKCCEDSVLFLKRHENDRVFMFLVGLNKRLDEVRGRILGKIPLSSLREAFSEVRREEARQGVMMGKSPYVGEVESSALITKNEDRKSAGKKPWCKHCKRQWHTRDTCWKLHGKPLNWKKKERNEGHALQAGTSNQEKQSPSSPSPFTKEQLDQLYKLLESQTSSCSIAQRGNFPNTALLSVTPSHTWIIDSGATDHMTGESSLFSSYSPCAGNHKIKIADGSLSAIAGKGSVILSPKLTLKDVLHVPNLSCNLLSITKLTKDINCQANFFHSHCTFKDLSTGKMIGNAKESGGLYYLDNGLDFKDQQKTRPPEMPQHNDSDKETQSRFTTIDPTWKGNVFERRNHKQRNEGPILRPFQDSEPIDNPTHHLDTGKSSSILKSHVEYPDLDLPIEALKIPKWKEAVLEEMRALEKNQTWRVMTLPTGKNTVGCKWVFTVKYNSDNTVERYKARLVAKGFTQTYDLLEETGMSGCRPADTPMELNAKLWEKGSVPVEIGRYQRLVGKLIYLAHTRPDIAFSVSVVSQFMHSPYEEHLEAVYRILRYLKSNPGKGLCFKKTNDREVSIFTDADWAGSITDRKSTTGYCAYVWGNLVTWRSKKQGVVARSSAEAEFRAMAQGICELLWIRKLLEELKMKVDSPLKLFCDSKAAISIAHNPQTADILTKSLARPNFERLIAKLGMTDIYAPT
ncbi:uncharacterized protein [Cicer arietinum]|uniref:uncharacterized protein n=1 Tax=Cicer arietinum TaxID=3827 RepID=UPI003CC66E05